MRYMCVWLLIAILQFVDSEVIHYLAGKITNGQGLSNQRRLGPAVSRQPPSHQRLPLADCSFHKLNPNTDPCPPCSPSWLGKIGGKHVRKIFRTNPTPNAIISIIDIICDVRSCLILIKIRPGGHMLVAYLYCWLHFLFQGNLYSGYLSCSGLRLIKSKREGATYIWSYRRRRSQFAY